MRKITATQRVTEIFTNEPLETARVLVEVARTIVATREGRKPARSRPARRGDAHEETPAAN